MGDVCFKWLHNLMLVFKTCSGKNRSLCCRVMWSDVGRISRQLEKDRPHVGPWCHVTCALCLLLFSTVSFYMIPTYCSSLFRFVTLCSFVFPFASAFVVLPSPPPPQGFFLCSPLVAPLPSSLWFGPSVSPIPPVSHLIRLCGSQVPTDTEWEGRTAQYLSRGHCDSNVRATFQASVVRQLQMDGVVMGASGGRRYWSQTVAAQCVIHCALAT